MSADPNYSSFRIEVHRKGAWLVPDSPLDPRQALWAMEQADKIHPLKQGDCLRKERLWEKTV